MLYRVQPTKRYQKSLKRLFGSGQFKLDELNVLIGMLTNALPLPPQYQNHKLRGEYVDCFECHIKGDLLLIYHINLDTKILTVVDIGTHSELFG